MASIFKRAKRDKHAVYWIQYKDWDGRRKTAKGFTDKGLTEEYAAKLEGEARLRSTGMIDPEQEKYTRQKLTAIAGHVAAYEESLADNVPRYVVTIMTRIRRVIDGCGFKSLADLQPEAVQGFLRGLRKTDGIGHRTYNH